ncbi:hypothetical protein YTPLAS21_19360 [Candidatus Nitrosocosmicus sp.]|nr:hypothetical protein YTPLAS21_19360 [Candidatus Nitrosocosmicus sp.]
MKNFEVGDEIYILKMTFDDLIIYHGRIEGYIQKNPKNNVFRVFLINSVGYTHAREKDCFKSKQECIQAFKDRLDEL